MQADDFDYSYARQEQPSHLEVEAEVVAQSTSNSLRPKPRKASNVTSNGLSDSWKTIGLLYREAGWFATVNNNNNTFQLLSASEHYVQDMFSLSQSLFISVYFMLLLPHLSKTMNTNKTCSL